MAAARRRTRPGIIAAIIVIAVVVLLVVVEIVARVLVGRITAQEVEQQLPDGLSADVSAAATGTCVTCELLGGSLSGIHVTSDDVTFGDVTGAASVDAHDVKLGSPITVGSLDGSIGIDEDELNALLQEVAAQSGIEIHSIELRDDGISYGTEVEVFGETVGLSNPAAVVVCASWPRRSRSLRASARRRSSSMPIASASKCAWPNTSLPRCNSRACSPRLSTSTSASAARAPFRSTTPRSPSSAAAPDHWPPQVG